MTASHIQEISHFAPDAKYSSTLLAIQHHMGLGDHIHLSGLVRYTLVHLGFVEVLLFCKEAHYETIKRLYVDEDQITVVSVGDIYGGHCETGLAIKHLEKLSKPCVYLRLGFEHYPGHIASKIGNPSFIFYDLARVPREVRWEYFKYQRNESEEKRLYQKLNPTGAPYIFVHDDGTRGFNITREDIVHVSPDAANLHIIRNDINENILDFALLLEGATEIHCMASSFACFADLLDMEKVNCFYHNIRPVVQSDILDEDTKHNWTWIG